MTASRLKWFVLAALLVSAATLIFSRESYQESLLSEARMDLERMMAWQLHEVSTRETLDTKMNAILSRFRQELSGIDSLGSTTIDLSLEESYSRILEPVLPDHQVFFFTGSPSAILLEKGSRDFGFLPFLADFIRIACHEDRYPEAEPQSDLVPPPFSKEQFDGIRGKIQKVLNVPFPLAKAKRSDGRLMILRGVERTLGLYFSLPRDRKVGFLALFDLTAPKTDFLKRLQFFGIRDREIGLAFLSLRSGRPVFSDGFSRFPELRNHLEREASILQNAARTSKRFHPFDRKSRFRKFRSLVSNELRAFPNDSGNAQENDPFWGTSLPPLFWIDPRFSSLADGDLLIVAEPLRRDADFRLVGVSRISDFSPIPEQAKLFRAAWVAIGVLACGMMVLLGKRLSGIPRISLNLFLMGSFLTISLLPLSSADLVLRKLLFETHMQKKDHVSRGLSEELSGIDDRARMSLASFSSFVISLKNEADLNSFIDPPIPTAREDRFRSFMEGFKKRVNGLRILMGVGADSFIELTTMPGGAISVATEPDMVNQISTRIFREMYFKGGTSKVERLPSSIDGDALKVEQALEGLKFVAGPQIILAIFYYHDRMLATRFFLHSEFSRGTLLRKRGRPDLVLNFNWTNDEMDEVFLESERSFLAEKSLTSREGILVYGGSYSFDRFFPSDCPASGSQAFPTLLELARTAYTKNNPLKKILFLEKGMGVPAHGDQTTTGGTGDTTTESSSNPLMEPRTRNERSQYILEARPARSIEMTLAGFREIGFLFGERGKGENWANVAVILLLTAALLLGAFVAWFYFLAPIQDILGKVECINRDEFHVRLDQTRADEFGAIGEAFNRMAQGLEEGLYLRRFVSDSVRKVVRDGTGDTVETSARH